MNLLGNNEILTYLFIALASGLAVCMFAFLFIPFGVKIQKWLDRKIESMPDRYDEKKKRLIAEYSTYTTEDLLEELKKVHFKGTFHNYAIFHVLSNRVDEEWIIPRIQQLQEAINPQTRMNANFVMTHYYEKQYTNCSTEELIELLEHIEDRNEQEAHALLMISLSRIEDDRIRQYVYQLLCSTRLTTNFNAEYIIKEYFEKQKIDDTTEDLVNLLNNMESRNKQEITALLTVAESRMKNQKVNLCIEQLQNSKNHLIREHAKQMIKDYMT